MPLWWQQPATHPSESNGIIDEETSLYVAAPSPVSIRIHNADETTIIDLTDEDEKIASMQNYKLPVAGKIDITIKENGSVTLTTTSQKPVPFSTDPTVQTTKLTSKYLKLPQAFSAETMTSTWKLSPTPLGDTTSLNMKLPPVQPSVRVVDCAKFPLSYKKNVSKKRREKSLNGPSQLALHLLKSVTEDKINTRSPKKNVSFNADQPSNNAEIYRRVDKTPPETSRRTFKYENFMKSTSKYSESKNNESFVGIKMKKTWKTIKTTKRKSADTGFNTSNSLIDTKKQRKTELEHNTQTNKSVKQNKYDKNPNLEQIGQPGVNLYANSMPNEVCDERNDEEMKYLVLSKDQKNYFQIEKDEGIDFKMNKGFIGMKIQNPLSTDINLKRHKSLKGINKQRKSVRKNKSKTNKRIINETDSQRYDKKTILEPVSTFNIRKSKEVEGLDTLKACESVTDTISRNVNVMQDEVCRGAREEQKLCTKKERDLEIEIEKTSIDYRMNKNLIGLKIHKDIIHKKKIIADSIQLKCKPSVENNTESPLNMVDICKVLDRCNTLIEPVFGNHISCKVKSNTTENLPIESEILKSTLRRLPSVSISIKSDTKHLDKNDLTVNNCMEGNKNTNINCIDVDNSLEEIVPVMESKNNQAKSSMMSKNSPKVPVISHSAPVKQSDAFTKTISNKESISSNDQQKTAAQPKVNPKKVSKPVTPTVRKVTKRKYQRREPPNEPPFNQVHQDLLNVQDTQMLNFLGALRNPNTIVNCMQFGNYMQHNFNPMFGNYWPPALLPKLSVKPTVAQNLLSNQNIHYNFGEMACQKPNLENSQNLLKNDQHPNLSNVIGGQMIIGANTKYSQVSPAGLITHTTNTNQEVNKNLMINGTVNNIETSLNGSQSLPKIPFTTETTKSSIVKQSDVFTKPINPLPGLLYRPHKRALYEKRTSPPEAHISASLPKVPPRMANYPPLPLQIPPLQKSVYSSSANTTVIDYSAHTNLQRPFPYKTCVDEKAQRKPGPSADEIMTYNTSARLRGNNSQDVNMQLLDGDTEKLLHQIDSLFDSE